MKLLFALSTVLYAVGSYVRISESASLNGYQVTTESQETNHKDNDKTNGNSERHDFKKPKPPSYLSYLLEDFETMNSKRDILDKQTSTRGPRTFTFRERTYYRPTKRIFYAWVPTEINEVGSPPMSTVTYHQKKPRSDFGDFSSVQITLTLRDDVMETDFPLKTFLTMYTFWDKEDLKQEIIQTQPIQRNKRYYSFDITEFMSSRLQQNITKPNLVNVSFQVTSNQERDMDRIFSFNGLFDVQVNLPIVVYLFNGFVPSENLGYKKRRKRRALLGKNDFLRNRPPTQCQRREFLVTPEEVFLPSIIGPKMLDLGFCSGSCQFPLYDSYFNFTMHSFLLDRFKMGHTFEVPRDFPHSNCVPISYKSLSILEEVDTNQYEGDKVENMSVETCGCR